MTQLIYVFSSNKEYFVSIPITITRNVHSISSQKFNGFNFVSNNIQPYKHISITQYLNNHEN